jgi:hypothetical protein
MGEDLSDVLSQYRDALGPLIEGIKDKRERALASRSKLLSTDPSAYTMAETSSSSKAGKRRAPRHSPYSKRQKASHSASPNLETPLISLQAFLSNAFYLVVIQDDDEIFELTYSKTWSQHVKEK